MNSSPEYQAGEIVKSSLRSPGSYKFVDGEILWQSNTPQGERTYVVAISYDAQNGFGALLRGCAVVSFLETKEKTIKWNRMFGFQEMEGVMTNMCRKDTPSEIKRNYAASIAKINFEQLK